MRTQLLTRLFLAASASLLYSSGSAQIKRNVVVYQAPDAERYDIGNPDFRLQNGYAGEQRWVVYVAFQDAPTFVRPAGIVRQQTLKFGQPCYVIGQRGDFLKLAKYNPRLVSRRFAPQHIANWKEVEYLGWIHRNQVLPYRTALKNEDTKAYVKYITALRGRQVLETPQAFFDADSLNVFGRPDMVSSAARHLPINTIVYAYRLSADRKFYLVGRSPECPPDSAEKVLLGWMPVHTVQPWGEKAFVELPRSVRAVADSALAPTLNLMLRPAPRQTLSLSAADPVLNRYRTLPQSLMPVYAWTRDTRGTPVIRTAALSNVLDARDNRVFNILGTPLTYDRYQTVKGAARQLNVVFLVDGAASAADFSSPVMTVLQQLQLRLDTTQQFDRVRYAGVLYREQSSGDCPLAGTLPLTTSYPELSRFFEEGLARARECGQYGSNVYGGIPTAASLLAGHEDESNVVIIIGSSAPSGANAYNWNTLVNSLTSINARLLVYQTHSERSTAYNDYVIDARKLIVQSADNISELRKELLVEAPKATAVADFRLSTGEQNAFTLDYPAAARWQGGVVFPAKFGTMPLLSLTATLDTMLTQVYSDNEALAASLDRVFESYAGNLGTRVDARLEPLFGPYTYSLPDTTRRHFRRSFDVFRFSATLPLEDTAALGRSLLLSKDEFSQYMDMLTAAVLVLDAPADDRRPAGRLLKRQTRAYVRATGMKKPMPYRRMTVADAFAVPTGMPVDEPALKRVRLKRLGKVSAEEYTAVQAAVMAYHTALQRRTAAGALPKVSVAAGAAPALLIREPL